MEVFKQVEDDYPSIFTHRMAYDGQKIAYSAEKLELGSESRTVNKFQSCI